MENRKPQRHKDSKGHEKGVVMKTKGKYSALPEEVELIATEIVDAAYKVYNKLGPGLLEKVYEVCFCHELTKKRISSKRQVIVPIKYDELEFEEGFRLDVLVGDKIICELKAVEKILPVHEAQLLSYLKITKYRLRFLINFNSSSFKDVIKRRIL